MQRAIIFIVSYIMYLLLTFLPDRQELIIGLFVAFFVTFIFSNIIQFRPKKLFEIRRYFYSIYYMFVFLYYFIKANVDVAYRVLHPGMPINPGIVKIKTDLKSDLAITALANSISLAPGTLAIDVTGDGFMYVHCMDVKATQVEEATKLISGRFERILREVFE